MRGKINVCAIDTAKYVGVGDVYALYGQSNAVGQGSNNQVWTHPTLKAGNFQKDYQWHLLADPVQNNANCVDAVHNVGASGSIWPIIADSIMANYNVPVGYVPCAMSGYPINSLIPGVDHLDRSTMYGSMHNRVNTVNGVKSVLFWQGEADASQDRSQEYYNIRLDSLANSTYNDFNAKIMPVLLQNGDVDDASEAKIRAAVIEAWTDNPNVLEGPDLSDLTTDDGAHIKIDVKIDSCANRFWRKIRDNIYEAP